MDRTWQSWIESMRRLANADDADPAARQPAEVIDGGPWRGPTLVSWLHDIEEGAHEILISDLRRRIG